MNQAQALDTLKRLCAWDKTPALEMADLKMILDQCKCIDSEAREIDDTDYVETYDLNLAAQRAWQTKAGNAAHITNFSSDGEKWDVGSLIKHCLRMADEYGRKRTASISSLDGQGLVNGLYPWQIANYREVDW